MASDPLVIARTKLEGATFVEISFNPDSVNLILRAKEGSTFRLSADAVAPANAPVPDDAGLAALSSQAVDLVEPLFGARVTTLHRRGDNAYVLAFERGEQLSLLRSSDDRITDNVVLLSGQDLCVLLE